MPRRSLRSRSLIKEKVVTPSGRRVTHFIRKAPERAKCASCGKILAGVPRGLPCRIRKLPVSCRRPSRPYGGNLCTECTRKIMKEKARGLSAKL
jgi:large subunit ribosomal protein L34e